MLIYRLKEKNIKQLNSILDTLIINIESIEKEYKGELVCKLKGGMILIVKETVEPINRIEFSIKKDEKIIEYIHLDILKDKVSKVDFMLSHYYYSNENGKESIIDCTSLYYDNNYHENSAVMMMYPVNSSLIRGNKLGQCIRLKNEPIIEFMSLKESVNQKVKRK